MRDWAGLELVLTSEMEFHPNSWIENGKGWFWKERKSGMSFSEDRARAWEPQDPHTRHRSEVH